MNGHYLTQNSQHFLEKFSPTEYIERQIHTTYGWQIKCAFDQLKAISRSEEKNTPDISFPSVC